jgi:hypothetical protein
VSDAGRPRPAAVSPAWRQPAPPEPAPEPEPTGCRCPFCRPDLYVEPVRFDVRGDLIEP